MRREGLPRREKKLRAFRGRGGCGAGCTLLPLADGHAEHCTARAAGVAHRRAGRAACASAAARAGGGGGLRIPPRYELEQLRRFSLAASDTLDKGAALAVTRLFHAMETLLRHECAERERRLSRALNDIEQMRLHIASSSASRAATRSTRYSSSSSTRWPAARRPTAAARATSGSVPNAALDGADDRRGAARGGVALGRRHPRPRRGRHPGRGRLARDLAARGVPYVVLSNTGTRGGAEVAAELSATLGVPVPAAA